MNTDPRHPPPGPPRHSLVAVWLLFGLGVSVAGIVSAVTLVACHVA